MITTAFAIGLIFWLPGALMLRLPGRSQPYRASLAADERWFWAVLLSSVWSTALALCLGLADSYTFDRLLGVNGVCSALLIVIFRRRLLFSAATRPTLAAVVPAAVVAIGCLSYFPASEYVIGGKDPGTYLNEGIQIAQRGSVIVRDPVVRGVPESFRDLFFPSHHHEDYYSTRFMGFFIQDPVDGRVIAQFPHFYPASIAIAYGLDGLTGARNAVGAWAILAALAVYFAGADLFGRTAAGIAAALLSINVVTVWFARYPNSELPMQALIFASLLAASRARRGGSAFFGVAAGAILGLSLFLRYEVLLAIAAFAGVAVFAPITRDRFGWGFAGALILTAAAGLWYLLDPMRAYSAYPLGFLQVRGAWMAAAAAAAALLVAVVRISVVQDLIRSWLPPAAALALGGLAVYAYVFREPGGRTALGDAIAFRSFGWYVTPGVLVLASAGAAFFTWRRFWTMPVFLMTFAVFSVFFFYKTRIVPEHFWTSRRFLSVALPGALLLAAALVSEIVGRIGVGRLATRFGWREPLRSVVATTAIIAVFVPVARTFASAAAPVLHHVEYAGVIPRLEALAARIGENDLLLVESRNAGSDLHVLAVPLAYIYARQVLVLDSAAPDKRLFEAFVAWAGDRYDRVLFLGGGGSDVLTRSVTATPLGGDTFQVPEYDTPLNQYPSGVHAKEFEYGLYEMVPAETAPAGSVSIAIGAMDDLNVVRFHAREVHGETGIAYRWSQGQSYVLLGGLAPSVTRLTIWLSSGGRPVAAPAPVVEISLANQPIGTATPKDAIEPYSFDLPGDLVGRLAEARDPVRLQLRVPTWTPRDYAGGPDTRRLGVIVSRVEVR